MITVTTTALIQTDVGDVITVNGRFHVVTEIKSATSCSVRPLRWFEIAYFYARGAWRVLVSYFNR